jgi:hypothetical protein
VKDVMCFRKGGKLMTEEEKIIGGFHRTERLFKKQTCGLLYKHLILGEDKDGK